MPEFETSNVWRYFGRTVRQGPHKTQEPTMPSFLDDRVDSDAILEDIRSIVEIESPSRNATGVNRVLETSHRA